MQFMIFEQQSKKRLLMSQPSQQQQFQLSMQQNQQPQAQKSVPGRQPNGQQQMSAQDTTPLMDLTNRLLSQASEEEKKTTRASLQSRMDPQQLQKYQAQGLDPLFLYYRSQAMGRLRAEKQTRLAQAQVQLQQQQQAQLQAKAAMSGLGGSGAKTVDMGSGFLPTPPRSAQSSPLNQGNAKSAAVQQHALQHTFAQQQVVQQLISYQQQQHARGRQMAQQYASMQQTALQPSYPPPHTCIDPMYLQNPLQRPKQLSHVQILVHQIKTKFPHATQEQVMSMISDPVARSVYQQQLANPASYHSYHSQCPQDIQLPDPGGNNVLQPGNIPAMGMLPISFPLSPKPESPVVETVHNQQVSIYDVEDVSGNKSTNHSSTHNEIIVHSDPEGATARLSEEGTTISATHPQDQSQPQISLDPEHDKVESPPNPPNDVLTRNNSLSSFTEDDTDWGEEEDTSSYDFKFADFSAVSDGARDEIKVGLTRPVFSPMKQGIVDRVMKEFWSLWDGEGGIFR
jgi:hypothetical protein